MRHPLFKLGVFLALWYECAVEMNLGGIAAFVVALLLRMMAGAAMGFSGQALRLLGPRMLGLLLLVPVWAGLF